jgi:hypothetical protein
VRLFFVVLSYIQKLEGKNSVYIELLVRIDMHRADILTRLKIMIWDYEDSEGDEHSLYVAIRRLYDAIEDGSI